MVCWRRRSNGKYKRIVRGRVVEQTYSSAPERQLMRAACSREERAHTQQRSRVATTGRNTLKREFDIVDAPAKLQLGGAPQPAFVKKMAVAARAGDRASALWRASAPRRRWWKGFGVEADGQRGAAESGRSGQGLRRRGAAWGRANGAYGRFVGRFWRYAEDRSACIFSCFSCFWRLM